MTEDSSNGLTANYDPARAPCDAQHGGEPAEIYRRRRAHAAAASAGYHTELKFTTPLTYLVVDVSVGNLITEDTEVIVNPANRYLRHEAGAAKVIATAAGPALIAECTEFIKAYETLPIAHVTHTSAGNLPGPIGYVIHTVGPDVKEIPDLMQCLELLKATFLNCLVYANDVLCAKSIAIPAIGAGLFGVPMDIVNLAITYAIQSFDRYMTILTPDRQNLGHIKFVDIDRQTTMLLIDGLAAHLALDLLSECAGPGSAGPDENTDANSTGNRLRACPADNGGKHTTALQKSISGDAGAGAHMAYTANRSADCADTCRRPRRRGNDAHAAATYPPTRNTSCKDRQTTANRQQDIDGTRHTLAEADTNHYNANATRLHEQSITIPSLLTNNDTKHNKDSTTYYIATATKNYSPPPAQNVTVAVRGTPGHSPAEEGGNPGEGDDGHRACRDRDMLTLQTQHIDKDLGHMIDYLQHGSLPDDDKTARRVLLTKDNFAIRNGKLIHLGIKRQKNNGT